MLALLETRMEDHSRLRDTLQFNGMLEHPAIGWFEGIVLLWHYNVVTVTCVRQSTRELHAMVKVNLNNIPWLLSIIYASTYTTQRNMLWDNFYNVKSQYNGP